MRICRFDDDRLGIVVGEEVADVTAVADALPPRRWPYPRGDQFIAALDGLRPALEDAVHSSAPRRPLGGVTLKSPVANPGKIIAAPVNYMAHVEESRVDAGINFGTEVSTIERYGLFLKATSSLIGCDEKIVVRPDRPDRRTDHEIELALVIGVGGRNIPEDSALSHVAGYCQGLDITIRGTEDRSYRKSLDTFTVLGPWLVTADEFGRPGNEALSLDVNGEPRQRAHTRDLIWSVAQIIAFASHAYTLDPGDVILTGTPEGVGPIAPGDVIESAIDRIGRMRVEVAG